VTGTVKEGSRQAGAYRPGPGWDEACAEDGSPREHYAALMDALGAADLCELTRAVDSHLAKTGATFGAGAETDFRVDPVPRILPAAEWRRVEAGLVQRTRALAAFVADVYSDREIVRSGKVPARVVESSENFEPWMLGVQIPADGFVTGLDLVRGDDGELRVLEDNMRTPSGIAYLLAAREAADAHLPLTPPEDRGDPAAAFAVLAQMLRDAAPEGVDEPFVALLSDGPSNSAWWEHGQVASALSIPLLAPGDLSVHRGRVHAELGGGNTRAVDVLYRRTDEDRLRTKDGKATWLAELLLEPVRSGTVSVVNPFGSGVADDKLVHAYVEEMVRFYLGEEPVLKSVPTYDLGDPDVLASALPRIDELVVKPRYGLGGSGIVICPHASEDDRRAVARRVVASPGEWIAQELIQLSTHPTICDGGLEPRHVDLRPYAIGGAGGATAVAGGLTRVALDRGSLVVNSSQNGGGKDTWVPGRARSAGRSVIGRAPQRESP
jgi:uncharacterized circularly permuted ATP-grasp superfamily protein